MIYLDHHATTPCDPQVVEAMLPFFGCKYGNAAIGLHQMGREAKDAVEVARGEVAALMGCDASEVVFTSGATESNNLVLFGLFNGEHRRKIVTTVIEHKSVLGPCEELERRGAVLIKLPVDKTGRISAEAVRDVVDDKTLLVSVQMANNEIGTIQDVQTFAEIAHAKGALFHCDAAQALGKTPLDVEVLGADCVSVSSHKVYGPKGIGALFVRKAARRQMTALMYGGSQEEGLRPGTTPVPLCVGFGQACKILMSGMAEELMRIAVLRDRLEKLLLDGLPGAYINGDTEIRLPNNISLTIPGIDGESLALAVRGVALSTGAACNSGSQEPSYVLRALGLGWDDANSTVRLGIGRFNTLEEIIYAGTEIVNVARRLGAR